MKGSLSALLVAYVSWIVLLLAGKTTTTWGFVMPHHHGSTRTVYGGLLQLLPTTRTSSISRRKMVLTMPDSLIEETSTQDLLDQILDESLRTSARRPIMIQFDPSSKAIWRQWRGTVFADTWRSVAKHVLFAAAVYFLFHHKYPGLKTVFKEYSTIWAQGLSVTTFTLTFFVNQAYTLWRNCLSISRRLQGKLNDLVLIATSCAKRVDVPKENCSRYAVASRQLLLVLARYVRLFNILSYASFARSHRPLVTPRGMRRLVARGLLTEHEKQMLVGSTSSSTATATATATAAATANYPNTIMSYVTATQRHNVVLQWILRALLEGYKAGHFDDSGVMPRTVTGKVVEIRGEANAMEGVLRGRMSFGYAHIVQILVDVTLWMYPIMAFASNDWPLAMGLLGSGFLTICYQGLFDLAKRFLDPFHNENFWLGDDALVVDTLIAETNAGSLRVVYGLDEMPISYQTIKTGNFSNYLLPNEGYTVEEAHRIKLAKQAQEAATAAPLTPQQYEERATEMLEAAKQEYEETKLIMETPAGFEFVPGLDDEGESLAYLNRNMTEMSGGPMMTDGDDHHDDDDGRHEDFLDGTPEERYDDFIEAVKEDYKSVIQGEVPATSDDAGTTK